MDVRSPFFQNVATILVGVMFLNPIVSAAAELTVAAGSGASVGQAGNGVPIVNIAAPNSSGLSHNTFKDYNVGQQGLILNNATERTQNTQLGGIILGNANLNGRAAGLILNEVTGANASRLQGYTEVAGQSAHVVVANPHGITCDGCGFINTPRVTLSTGTPIIENGRLDRFDVNGGHIGIEGQGLNASNVDQFDLITRSAKINAELHANKLNIIAGRNEVDANTLVATAKTLDGSDKPLLAIDSSALGGMYAGAIRLVGTEAGVGVKLAGDMAASAGDIQIDAGGKLTMGQASASNNLAVRASDVELTGKTYASGKADVSAQGQLNVLQSLAAGGNVSLHGRQVVNRGVVEAGVKADNSRAAADLSVDAQQVRNAGTLIGNRQLQINASEVLDNQGGTISGKTLAKVETAHLDNRQGRALAEQRLEVVSANLNNAAGLIQSQGAVAILAGNTLDNREGEIRSNADLTLAAGAVDNRQAGRITSQETLTADVASLDNRGGGISARQGLTLKAGSVNTGDHGLISSGAALALEAGRVEASNQGEISAKGDMTLSAGEWVQQSGRLIGEADIGLHLKGGKLDNQGGLIAAQGQLTLGHVGQLDNRTGTLNAQRKLTISARQVDNRDQGLIGSNGALILDADRLDSSNQGEVSSSGDLALRADELVQQNGRLLGQAEVKVDVSGQLDNRGGVIHGKQGLSLVADGVDNSAQGLISSGGLLVLTANKLDSSSQGEVSAQGDIRLRLAQLIQEQGRLIGEGHVSLDLAGGVLNNRGGVIHGKHGLSLLAGAIDNRDQGLINSAGVLTLAASRLDSSRMGEVSAEGDIDLSLHQLVQQNGKLIGKGKISVDLLGGKLDNQDGLLNAHDNLELRNVGELNNAAGELSSSGNIAIAGEQFSNTQGGRVIAAGQLSLDVNSSDNSNAGLLSGWQGVRIEGVSLDNRAKGTVSSRDGTLDVMLSGTLDNSEEGALVSQGNQRIQAGSFDNRGKGILSSESSIDLNVVGTLENGDQGLINAPTLNLKAAQILNQGGQMSSTGDLTLSGGSLDNSGGSLSAAQALIAKLTGSLRNKSAGHLASGGPLLLDVGHLDNRGGQLASQGLLDLFAASLDNSAHGTLAAQDGIQMQLSGALVNSSNGLIYSRQGALSIVAVSLDNDTGTLQAKNLVDADISVAVSNKNGAIVSETGDINLSADRFDNRSGGMLASTLGSIRLSLVSLFDNSSGTIQAKQDIDLSTAANGQVLNASGHLSAVVGNNRIQTGAFDNQGGGLYAGNLLDVHASSFANQVLTIGQGGKVSARAIDFSLTGALNNSYGLIEAGDTLKLGAASFDNRHGALRALGQTGESRLTTTGTLDNRDGRIEVANTNLSLNLSSLLNGGGSILHVGSGSFGLASSTLVQAGGTLVTGGALAIDASNWNHSGILQARELTLNVDTFNQTASGQLLATQRLSASGGNWSNAGLIASDGSLDLTLRGIYSGNGRLTSLGDLILKGTSLDLASAGSIAGGALSQLTFTGQASNRGQLTSSGDFTLRAATLNNYGTLGSAENLSLYAPTLYNERGLIFSGKDMLLRSLDLTNLRGNLYSLGGLDVAANDSSGRANRFENTSGSVESAGNMLILANTLINQRADFATEMRLVSGSFDVYWDDVCDGKGCELYFRSVENYADVIAGDQNAPIAFITSGGNLDVHGSRFENLYSTVSAAGNIGITVDTLRNIGMGGGEQRHYNAGMYTRDRSIYSNFIATKNLFNRYNDPNGVDYRPGEVSVADVRATAPSYFDETSYSVPTSGAVVASAIIQAGGAVNITAQQRIDNGVVRQHIAGIGQIGSQSTGVGTTASTTNWAITSQLPPDLAQKQVNPLNLPGFSLPVGENGLFRLSDKGGLAVQLGNGSQASEAGENRRVGDQVISGGFGDGPIAQQLQKAGGLPPAGRSPSAHKYLIETNPALTELKQFMGSDYLLANLGYDPDAAQKRLGDGLYEQHLIRQAIVERTGQRYLAGLYSDEAMFRYLMDNAIASKDRLGLSLGVSLSADQVAALTHDIVWMEEHVVLGERVLVPVVYLAQAQGRLAGNGALIQGRDLNLISGGDLSNQGTLRASQNLNAHATNITNAGLMEATERLQLMAVDSLRNASGGILKGRDVSLTALTGDVINERTVTTTFASGGNDRIRNDIVNNAARIEAGGDLSIIAGRDIHNIGSVIQAGGDASLNAGRDVVIDRQEEVDTYEYRRKRESGYHNSVTQYGSSVTAGGNLDASAGRDVAVIASEVKAGGNITVDSAENLIVASAADEYHQYSYRKQGKTKTTRQNDNVSQVSSLIQAGGDVLLAAGDDIGLIASRVEAGNDAYLYAGGDLSLLAAEDSDYSLYDMKKKGSFGATKTQRDEVTTVRNIGSTITTGGDLTLVSEGDQLYQKARLESGNHLTLESGGAITFEAVKDLDQESHEKSKSSLAWQSAKGKGTTDETLQQSVLIAKGETVINAVDGLQIDIKHVDRQTVSQTIDAMVQADPQLAWIKEAEARGDVDWQRVKEIHDSFKYQSSGLGAGAQLAIAIVMAAVVGPAAMGALGGAGTAVAAGGAAVATGAATNAAVSVINNRGDLGAVFKDVTSSDAVKGYVISGVTAGFTAGYINDWTGTTTNPITGKIEVDLASLKGLGQFAGSQVLQNGTATAVGKVLGQDGDWGDVLRTSLFNTLAAASFNAVGDYTKGVFDDGTPPKVLIHAVVGGLLTEASGGDFKTGALAAGINEATVAKLNDLVGRDTALLNMTSQLVGILAAATQSDVDASKLQSGAWVAANATNYNYLNHQEASERREQQQECIGGNDNACSRVKELNTLDKVRDLALQQTCRADPAGAACGKLLVDAHIARESFKPYEGAPEWNAQINDDPRLQQYSFQREVQSITNALAQTPQTTPELKRLVEAIVGTAAEFTIVGDAKALLEAETPFDYLLASVGAVPVIGKGAAIAIREAKGLFNAGKVAESAKVLEDLAGVQKGVGGTVERATTGIEWGKGIQGQGMPWENHLASQMPAGSRLPPNFKTFDFFDNATGVAISAKTLDTTTMAKVANPTHVYSSLKGNIDATVKFTEYSLGRTTLSSSQITARELQVAIPKGTTTAQWEQINRAVQYGQGKGVTVKITTVD
jgi:filamentous hemagglutinin